jgi:hydrogenase maturation protease
VSARGVVIGVGNEWRRDDGAGIEIARRVRAALVGATVLELAGDCVAMLDAWEGVAVAAVVDAVCSGAPPGTVHRLDGDARPLPAGGWRSSTHAFGVAEAVELARALRMLPPVLTVWGVEGGDFSAGLGLTPPVERAALDVARRIASAMAPIAHAPPGPLGVA